KVNREERPDIDAIYMAVCQAMTGHGGWPLNVVMSPERRPFYVGTYFPRAGRHGRPGLLELAPALSEQWRERRDELLSIAGQVTEHLQATMCAATDEGDELGTGVLGEAYTEFARTFDSTYGGFGRAPKFPTPHNLMFLLRYWQRTGQAKALEMVEKTLTHMGIGGVYDHIGYGFHRYSTDREWLLPHFEKMLYDQALLLLAYTEAYQATGKDEYARKMREIATYVLRDMRAPYGGLYSAEDADSEGEEGKFYVWKTDQLRELLPPDDAELAITAFTATPEGNFRDEATGSLVGSNILHLSGTRSQLAERMNMTKEQLTDRLDDIGQTLWQAREKRVHPYKDDKILTDWNGLMIAALAKAGAVLGDANCIGAARQDANFILKKLRQPDGRLLKRFRDGEAALPAQLDDYAFMVWGLIELYEATFQAEFLEQAIHLNDILVTHYWDDERGGFFLTAHDSEAMLVRPKDAYDGAIPSGNSVAALNNIRLARLTGRQDLEKTANSILNAFAGQIAEIPSAHTMMLIALDFVLGPAHEVVVVGKPREEDTLSMLTALQRHYAPNKVVILYPLGDDRNMRAIERLAPYLPGYEPLEGQAAAYVCSNYSCQRPTTDPQELLDRLSGQSRALDSQLLTTK
ncbi:MAG: thioredoxin domain-containing protein, partial [Bacillota bacterium]